MLVGKAARSIAIGLPPAMRNRAIRVTEASGVRPKVITSSGEGMKRPRSNQCEDEFRPRRDMSSVNDVRRDRDCSIFGVFNAMNDPDPCFWMINPSSAKARMALRTVTRDRVVSVAISRSGGSGLPGDNMA